MGLLGGSSSASSSSTNNSSTWGSGTIENWANNSFNPNINYTNEDYLDLNPYLQEFLNYETSGQGFANAKNVIGAGSQVFKQGLSRLEQAGSLSGKDIYDKLYAGVKAVNGSMQGYVNNQNQAIQNQVMVEMGNNLAQNATTMNAGGAVAGSSAMNNSAMGIMEGGAESMEKQESQLAMQVLRGSIGAVNNLAGGYARSQNGITKSLLGIGGDILKAGGKMNKNATSNFWNAAVYEQEHSQEAADVARKNAMINGNKGVMEDMYWLQTMLQMQGIDTNSTTTGKSSVSGGIF